MLKKSILILSVVMSLQGIFAMEESEKGGEVGLINFLMSLKPGLKEYPEFKSEHINLTDPAVLMPLLAEEFQNEECLSKALEIARSIYEVDSRVIETDLTKPTKYGSAFAMHPEIMAEAMMKCKGKVVLEIAGASGENAILLAFAGAKYVYMNDIELNEVKKFEAIKATLPPSVSCRLKSLNCSVFDILENENLESAIGFFTAVILFTFLRTKR